jgi:CRISPR-associated endonuclease Csn1
MQRIWGFDLGTASVGFAVVNYDEQKQIGRIDSHKDGDREVPGLGVRVFQEGVVPAAGGKTRATPNKTRRTKRLMRRQNRRKKQRKRELGKLLHEAGLLPAFGTPEWRAVVSEPGRGKYQREPISATEWRDLPAPQVRKAPRSRFVDPYRLRRDGIEQRLEPYELGRALYQLAKRRGFRGRPIEELKEEAEAREDEGKKKEKSVVKEGIERTAAEIGKRTLGAALAEIPDTEKRRGRYIDRKMIENEFERLWSKQLEFHPAALTATLKQRIHKTIFFQRPTFWRTKTLGKCPFKPEAQLCLKSSWLGQRFLALKRLNDLRLAGGNTRPLTDDERGLILPLLDRSATVTFGAIRKALKELWAEQGISKHQKFTHELAAFGPKKDKKEIPGNAAEARLREIFADAWEVLPARDRIRAEFAAKLFDVDYRRLGSARIEIRQPSDADARRMEFAKWARREYGIAPEKATELSQLGDNLPSGWLAYSEPAVKRMLEFMEAGDPEYEARRKAYPEKNKVAIPGQEHTLEQLDRLPSHPLRQQESRNPMVRRTLTELRKVVNNLLAVYGKPDLIRIELARDPASSLARKADFDEFQNLRNTLRKKAVEALTEKNITPKGIQIEKWLLWQETKEQCPYTGESICFDDLFRNGRFQVEHILPRSWSLDDGFGNKTLCHVEVNRQKNKMTPYGFFQTAEGAKWSSWEDVELRVRRLARDKGDPWGRGMPESKVRRFLSKEFPDSVPDEFNERQLQDSRYAAVECRKFLQRLGVTVKACNGALTHHLCHEWGLHALLHPDGKNTKNRDDHRHHAVDALAVALTTDAFVKRLSDFFARERQGEKPAMPCPWETFWEDTRDAVRKIMVSHRARRKVSGPLHAERPLRRTDEIERDKNKTEYHIFLKRVPLAEITADQVNNIQDAKVREAVQRHLDANGGDPRKAFKTLPQLTDNATGEVREIKKVRVRFKQQLALMVPLRPSPHSYADTGDNHHIALFRNGDEVFFKPISRLEAYRRVGSGKPLVERSHTGGSQFVMTLCKGDMVEFPAPKPDENGARLFVVVGLASKGQLELKSHVAADDDIWAPRVRSFVLQGARKVTIDPIGRVRPAHD